MWTRVGEAAAGVYESWAFFLLLGCLPFVIWYSFLEEHRQLTLLRLFHQAQRGARPGSR